MSSTCDYQKLTSRFKKTLKFPEEMFDSKHDYCFCQTCHSMRGDTDHYTRGTPRNIYVLPRGWRRFGIDISVPDDITADQVWKNWHVAFHGTSLASVESIWRVGLKMPGETMWNGKDIVELCGHYNDERKPEGFDTKQIFVSPSIKYAGDDAYAPRKRYRDRETKKEYRCRTAFQLRIKPSNYNIGPKTIRKCRIDKYINDSVLEWSTKNKDAIMLTGLLINMEEA